MPRGRHGQRFCKKLKGRGYRITKARELIVSFMEEKSNSHLSAEEVYNGIHEKDPDIGLTTVYRTLEILVELGIAAKFDFGDKRSRFELIDESQEKHHHHLVCTKCRRIIDYNDFSDEELELIKKMESGLSEKYGFRIKRHVLQFYGLCADCKEG